MTSAVSCVAGCRVGTATSTGEPSSCRMPDGRGRPECPACFSTSVPHATFRPPHSSCSCSAVSALLTPFVPRCPPCRERPFHQEDLGVGASDSAFLSSQFLVRTAPRVGTNNCFAASAGLQSLIEAELVDGLNAKLWQVDNSQLAAEEPDLLHLAQMLKFIERWVAWPPRLPVSSSTCMSVLPCL